MRKWIGLVQGKRPCSWSRYSATHRHVKGPPLTVLPKRERLVAAGCDPSGSVSAPYDPDAPADPDAYPGAYVDPDAPRLAGPGGVSRREQIPGQFVKEAETEAW